MSQYALATATRPGRPRVIPRAASAAAPRDEILNVAAELFVNRGFAATSTRDIAEKVGIRQASLYYHFAGKPGILAELLELSVRPSLEKVERIELGCPADVPEAALYLLALVDADTLATVPHNIGKLYRMPDVRNSEVFEEFQPALQELTDAYGRLGAGVVSGPVAATVSMDQLGGLLIQVVEVVIRIRSRGEDVTPAQTRAIAATCLRICGAPQERVVRATTTADDLLWNAWGVGADLMRRSDAR
ncbi:transcriptional regulator, TetR family [Nocardioides sp. YR527]|uniref:TetR/AcrR family transcriptional regulator n=1 Tax=Nocardioides sp. YR527 TaxID=1881028 RepID=UPI00087F6EEC|nr:TetR/AcrR family transcriptional regulator [Nocardioides sp. YR527]SDK49429.1 transcriptional regulator, TetR family [Nocardioides sp. YR527]